MPGRLFLWAMGCVVLGAVGILDQDEAVIAPIWAGVWRVAGGGSESL